MLNKDKIIMFTLKEKLLERVRQWTKILRSKIKWITHEVRHVSAGQGAMNASEWKPVVGGLMPFETFTWAIVFLVKSFD